MDFTKGVIQIWKIEDESSYDENQTSVGENESSYDENQTSIGETEIS